MGNWRTVHIDGTLDEAQVEAAQNACRSDWSKANAPYHALCFGLHPSLCGVNNWPARRINVVGNCYERDFTVESVADALRTVIAVAPSLRVKVHCGGEYESRECVATITVADGAVTVGPPEVKELPEISVDAMTGRMFAALQRRADHE